MEIIPRLSSSPRSLTFLLLANVFYTRITRFCRGCRRPPAASLSLSLFLFFALSVVLGGCSIPTRWTITTTTTKTTPLSLAGSQLTIRVFRRGRRISKASETGFLIRSTVVPLALVDKTDLVKRFFPLERTDETRCERNMYDDNELHCFTVDHRGDRHEENV